MKRSTLQQAAPLNGIWRIIPSSQITEILALAGMEFQILDREHGAYDYDSLLADITACQLHGCVPFVRVRGTDGIEVQRCLDLGAEGLVFPQLGNLAEFETAALMMDHAPTGTRGFNPFVRAYDYGSKAGKASSSEPPLFIPIVEKLSAVDDLDRILKIDRIDIVYIGSYDLSAELGCPGKMDDPRMVEVTARIIDACKANGKAIGHIALNKTGALSLVERGVQAIVHGVESHRIFEGFEGMMV